MVDDASILEQSTDMLPIAGSVDVAIPVQVFWECFMHADRWPRWNPCIFWVWNRKLISGGQLVWAFEPIRWWYFYILPGLAKIVEVEPNRKVTWEVLAVPGFYARHTYSLEDLGNGRTRFASWEKATGPTFRLLKRFWIAHFTFVKDSSLDGARFLESVYHRTGKLELNRLPPKNYPRSLVPLFVITIGMYTLLRGMVNRLMSER